MFPGSQTMRELQEVEIHGSDSGRCRWCLQNDFPSQREISEHPVVALKIKYQNISQICLTSVFGQGDVKITSNNFEFLNQFEVVQWSHSRQGRATK